MNNYPISYDEVFDKKTRNQLKNISKSAKKIVAMIEKFEKQINDLGK